MEISFVRLVILAGIIHSSIAIRCFICQSGSNTRCHDPIRSYELQLTECTPDVVVASSNELGRGFYRLGAHGEHLGKDLLAGSVTNPYIPMQCLKISYNIGEERYIIRGCHAGNAWHGDSRSICRALDDQTRTTPGAYVNYCDTCDRDACNGARSNIQAPSLFALMAVIIPTIFAAILRN